MSTFEKDLIRKVVYNKEGIENAVRTILEIHNLRKGVEHITGEEINLRSDSK